MRKPSRMLSATPNTVAVTSGTLGGRSGLWRSMMTTVTDSDSTPSSGPPSCLRMFETCGYPWTIIGSGPHGVNVGSGHRLALHQRHEPAARRAVARLDGPGGDVVVPPVDPDRAPVQVGLQRPGRSAGSTVGRRRSAFVTASRYSAESGDSSGCATSASRLAAAANRSHSVTRGTSRSSLGSSKLLIAPQALCPQMTMSSMPSTSKAYSITVATATTVRPSRAAARRCRCCGR